MPRFWLHGFASHRPIRVARLGAERPDHFCSALSPAPDWWAQSQQAAPGGFVFCFSFFCLPIHAWGLLSLFISSLSFCLCVWALDLCPVAISWLVLVARPVRQIRFSCLCLRSARWPLQLVPFFFVREALAQHRFRQRVSSGSSKDLIFVYRFLCGLLQELVPVVFLSLRIKWLEVF
jgi:hypothetical protein